jgi:hypothetical protein
MSNLLFYSLSTGVCIALFISAYQIFLKNNTRFNLCRFYLITSILLSFLIPLMPIDLGIKPLFQYEHHNVAVEKKIESINPSTTQGLAVGSTNSIEPNRGIDIVTILVITLLSISTLLLIRFMYRFGSIILIQLSGNRLENDEGLNLILIKPIMLFHS